MISDNLPELSFKLFFKLLLMLFKIEPFELVGVEPLEVSFVNILKVQLNLLLLSFLVGQNFFLKICIVLAHLCTLFLHPLF